MMMAEDYETYAIIRFDKIDRAFLERQIAIQEQLKVLQDTTRTRLQFALTLKKTKDYQTLESKTLRFTIDSVDEFILEARRLDHAIDQQYSETPKALALAREKEKMALKNLNELLSLYNLSIYAIDLSNKGNVHYYHKFRLKDSIYEGVFELDPDLMEIVSFKEVI